MRTIASLVRNLDGRFFDPSSMLRATSGGGYEHLGRAIAGGTQYEEEKTAAISTARTGSQVSKALPGPAHPLHLFHWQTETV